MDGVGMGVGACIKEVLAFRNQLMGMINNWKKAVSTWLVNREHDFSRRGWWVRNDQQRERFCCEVSFASVYICMPIATLYTC